MHGDAVSNSNFETRLKGEGNFSLNIKRQFELARKTFFKGKVFPKLRTDHFDRPDQSGQMSLFLKKSSQNNRELFYLYVPLFT
jgi:hypothetical protein